MLNSSSPLTFSVFLLLILTTGCQTEAGYTVDRVSSPLIELWRHLFYERRLSLNNDRSCGICHEQAKGFTDGFVRAVGTTEAVHPRNTLTLLNVSGRRALSWVDPNLIGLERQILVPLLGSDPVEMGASELIDEMLDELNGDPRYQELLATLDSPALDIELLALSISAFVSTLGTYDAPYDRYLAGDSTAIGELA